MIEARVECICVVGYHLLDLGVTMQKGDVLWFPEAQARASADLRLAERARAVTVHWKERCMMARQPIPVFVKRPPNKGRPPPPPSQLPVVEVAQPVGAPVPPAPASIAKEVAESLRGVMQEEIQKALRDHVPTVVHTQAPGEPVASARPADEPMFIPTGLVSKADEPPLNVASVTSDSSGLDDAAEALKVVRRKKKES